MKTFSAYVDKSNELLFGSPKQKFMYLKAET